MQTVRRVGLIVVSSLAALAVAAVAAVAARDAVYWQKPLPGVTLSEVDLRLRRLPREPQANLWIMASAGSIDPAWEPFLPA